MGATTHYSNALYRKGVDATIMHLVKSGVVLGKIQLSFAVSSMKELSENCVIHAKMAGGACKPVIAGLCGMQNRVGTQNLEVTITHELPKEQVISAFGELKCRFCG